MVEVDGRLMNFHEFHGWKLTLKKQAQPYHVAPARSLLKADVCVSHERIGSIRVTLQDSATLNVVHMGAMVPMQATVSRVKFLRLCHLRHNMQGE